MLDSDIMPDLPVFVAAVEAGGFSAAAARLNLSRSAVGKTIARLEGRLGVRLFHRTTRSLTLTEDGQAFFEHCRRALNEVQAARTMLDSGRREAAGRLRVSVPVLFGRQCVAPVLIRLTEDHPKLELDINFSDRLVDVVEDGFDLAVRNGPPCRTGRALRGGVSPTSTCGSAPRRAISKSMVFRGTCTRCRDTGRCSTAVLAVSNHGSSRSMAVP